jgi:glycosyltransferase involved in cell wall biosynthesis
VKRLAIISTHPIQYNAPLFELLAMRNIVEPKVFYTWGNAVLQKKYDPGFGKLIEWDIPLLQGYEYEFLENVASDKGSHHFAGIDNPGIIEALKLFGPDAILVYGWSFKSHLKVLRTFKNKVPLWFRGDSTLLDKESLIAALKRRIFLRWVYSYVDRAFYVGKANYDYFIAMGLKKNQLVFAPHSIDNIRFECKNDTCQKAARSIREKLNIKESDLVFLFTGKLEMKKDPALLLQAFTELNCSKNVHLVIVGNGDLETELKEKYLQIPRVHFMGFQNQMAMPAVYEMADVFILPSKGPEETWGLSVNEAMANGKVIIVSNKCGCAADLIEEGVNGFIFDSMDYKDLMARMKFIVEKIEVIASMKAASIKKIRSYNFTNIAQSIEQEMQKNNSEEALHH